MWDDMENQVRHRDLTMVEQAQCVAAYRITMGGRLSTGMYSELMYASHTAEPARPVLDVRRPLRRRPGPSFPAQLQPPDVSRFGRLVRSHPAGCARFRTGGAAALVLTCGACPVVVK